MVTKIRIIFHSAKYFFDFHRTVQQWLLLNCYLRHINSKRYVFPYSSANRQKKVWWNEILLLLLQKLVLKAEKLGVNLTVYRFAMFKMIILNPTITKIEMAQAIGISSTAIDKKREDIRDKLIRRVGPKKTGLCDVILE